MPPIIAPYSEPSRNREAPPDGKYVAVIADVRDIGLQMKKGYEGKPDKVLHMVGIAYEIDWRNSKGARAVLMQDYNLSSHEKSNLGAVILAAFPKLRQADLRDFDVERLKGRSVVVECELNKKGNARVVGVSPLSREDEPITQEVDVSAPFGLMKWWIKHATTAPTVSAAPARPAAKAKEPTKAPDPIDDVDGVTEEVADDEIPF